MLQQLYPYKGHILVYRVEMTKQVIKLYSSHSGAAILFCFVRNYRDEFPSPSSGTLNTGGVQTFRDKSQTTVVISEIKLK